MRVTSLIFKDRSRAGYLAPRRGQARVLVAMMTSVLFGILALVVDLGYIMVQRRQQQNAVDAAAMGVVKQLAGAIGIDSSGAINFVDQSDSTVFSRAQTLASGNWSGTVASRALTLDYLNCTGAVIRTATAGASTLVPGTTCSVRATGTSTVNSFFIKVADPSKVSTAVSARATARIAPTSAPTSASGLWPLTRWLNHPTNGGVCVYTFNVPCVFWSNNGGSQDTSLGSFKEKLFFSRESQCNFFGPPTLQLITAYDPARPGNPCGSSSQQQLDMEYWFRNGFGGTISIGNNIEATDTGNQGHNYSDQMREYINASPDGTHPSWGNYRTVHVGMWDVGEKWKNPAGPFQAVANSSLQARDRVRIADIRCFRFYVNQIDSSQANGHFVSCFQNTPPQNGPPSGLANTFQMTD